MAKKQAGPETKGKTYDRTTFSDTVRVRYTGKGKCFIIQHFFDPEKTETLTVDVPKDVYEKVLKPFGAFELVV